MSRPAQQVGLQGGRLQLATVAVPRRPPAGRLTGASHTDGSGSSVQATAATRDLLADLRATDLSSCNLDRLHRKR